MTFAKQPQLPCPPVTILIPTYGSAEVLQRCLQSLSEHAPANCSVFVLDDATPNDSVRLVCLRFVEAVPDLHYIRSENNRGFVTTCNWGCQLRQPDHDLLLLNSDTQVTSGFLEEMQAVLHLHERHAVVTPRSNNATIFSVPWNAGPDQANDSYQIWATIRSLLPRYHVMPTAVGFCMLIKAEVLQRFTLFDEIYSPGYNEENDFICRINRYGYSAIAANWAYVFHYESSSFGGRRAALEKRNEKTLVDRYPEYPRKVRDYIRFQLDPVDFFSPLRRSHHPRILYDLFHLPEKHSGTSEFGLNLLREIGRLIEDDYELYVGIGEARRFFCDELSGYYLYDGRPGTEMMFDLVYKPCQIFTWAEFHRMNRLAPRLCYTLQDIIGVRCDYLSSGDRQILFRKTAELSDRVFTISDFSKSDFEAFYGVSCSMRVIHHGTNAWPLPETSQSGDYILVMGNTFAHKGVAEAVTAIDGEWPVAVLGGENKPEGLADNVAWHVSGTLNRQHIRDLYARALLLVYPSYYEGYGLPVVDALGLGKAVVVLDSAVNRELQAATGSCNLHRIISLKQLPITIRKLFQVRSTNWNSFTKRHWREAAQEYVEVFRELLASEIDVARLRARWNTLRLVESVSD